MMQRQGQIMREQKGGIVSKALKADNAYLVFLAILAVVMVLFSANFAFAIDTSQCITYLSADNADTSGTTALTQGPCLMNATIAVGVGTGTTGKFGQAYSANTVDEAVKTTGNTGITGTMNASIGGWFYINSVANNVGYWALGTSGTVRAIWTTSGVLDCWNWENTCSSGTAPPTGTWFHFACQYDGANIYVYMDNVRKAKCTQALTTGDSAAAVNSQIAAWFDSTNITVDDLYIWGSNWTDDDRARNYANGTIASFFPDTPPPPPTNENITIIANNTLFTGAAIQVFNATVCGYFFNTTAGSIETNITTNATVLCNITVRSRYYHSGIYLGHNSTMDLVANLTQWVNLTIGDIYTWVRLTFNVTLTNGTYSDAANNTLEFRTPVGQNTNYIIRVGGYVVLNSTFNATNMLRPNFELFPVGISRLTFYNYSYNIGINFTRNISYRINYSCNPTARLDRYINDNFSTTQNLTCGSGVQSVTGNYTHNIEGWFNISWVLNTSESLTDTEGNSPLYSDLYNPTPSLAFSVLHGFNAPNATTSLTCNDTAYAGNITYNATFNGAFLLGRNYSMGTNVTNKTITIDGTNILWGACRDLFGQTETQSNYTVYYAAMALINEKTGAAFDLNEVTGAVAYFDDNSSNYDFKSLGTTYGNFTSVTTDKLRIELTYGDGTVIVRYVDVSLIDGPLRICAVENDTTFYEQLLTSAGETPVVLKNVFSNCIIAADYTRFAYQDSKVLKGYTIKSNYYLYIWADDDITGDQILLASIDGSIATYSNIDTLEFFLGGYDVSVVGDSISVKQRNGNETEVYYYNVQGDNIGLRVAIERRDTGAILLNTTDFTNPNEALIIFNHATLIGVNDTTLFKITVTRTTGAGDSDKKQFFNLGGEVSGISDGVIFIIGLLIIIFGLTFAASLHTFGWFGIFIILANIGVVSMASGAWYTTFLQGVNVIILVFLVIVMSGKNSVSLV